jgi:hypothetical protein
MSSALDRGTVQRTEPSLGRSFSNVEAGAARPGMRFEMSATEAMFTCEANEEGPQREKTEDSTSSPTSDPQLIVETFHLANAQTTTGKFGSFRRECRQGT